MAIQSSAFKGPRPQVSTQRHAKRAVRSDRFAADRRSGRCYGSKVTPAAALAVLSVAHDADARDAPLPHRAAADVHIVERPSAAPDIVVSGVHGLALMTVMRATETVLWPDPFARTSSFSTRYAEAFTAPPKLDTSQPFMRWDGDPLFINVVGHGVFGSELYLRARQCRFGWGGALAFAAATSAVWEYGFEANGVRPSAQDLVYTPLMGLALGELRYALHRAAGRFTSPAAKDIVRAVVDPLGELERAAGSGC